MHNSKFRSCYYYFFFAVNFTFDLATFLRKCRYKFGIFIFNKFYLHIYSIHFFTIFPFPLANFLKIDFVSVSLTQTSEISKINFFSKRTLKQMKEMKSVFLERFKYFTEECNKGFFSADQMGVKLTFKVCSFI